MVCRWLSINRLIKLFNIYVLPIYLYGAPLWMSKTSKTQIDEIDTVWTRYLKRRLLIPLHSTNSITYHISETTKLSSILMEKANCTRSNLVFPKEFAGLKLTLWDNIKSIYCNNWIEEIPPWFWLSKRYYALPSNTKNRKKLTEHLYDLNHRDFCKTESYHVKIDNSCFCKICGHQLEHFHDRYCEDNLTRCKAVRIVLHKIKDHSTTTKKTVSNNKRIRKKNCKFFGDDWINL